MSQGEREPTISDRLDDRPKFERKKVAQVKPRELLYRFLAGGLTSVGAGLVTLAFGPRAGGIFLAFPAILAASLTLIEEQEDSAEAREDARGAVIGGCAMAVFAAVAALTFTHLPGGVVLAIATVAWLASAFLGYLLAWFK